MKTQLLVASIATALLTACGGGGDTGSPTTTPQPSSSANTTVQFNLGDAPADRVVAVGMTVNSLVLTNAGGGQVTVLSSPRPIEMMQLMGTVTPLALSSVPQGTYTRATMTFGGASVTHVDTTTGQLVYRSVPGPMTASVSFNPALTLGATPTVINFDMNMAASVLIDGNGNVSMTPSLTAAPRPILVGSRDPEDGGMHGVTGTVSGINGNAFTLTMTQGLSGTSLMTHSGTHYSGLADMHSMGGNMLVSVDATPQADGTWVVDHVQSRMSAGGAMAAGLVTGVTGSPPTQLTLVMRDGAGNSMMSANLASTATVNIGGSTQFSIDADGVDLNGLPFTPQFDRTHLSKGQAVKAWSGSQIEHGHGMGGMPNSDTVTAASIALEQQGLRGTVSGYASNGSQASFTLTVPTDSAFAALTGATAVTVYQRSSTQVRGLSSLSNGSIVQVRGLLFVDGSNYRLVAGRIVAG
ncbi:MAG TPA: DUF4382 domain-containing protein [Burkholderiaceae bacterium]|nr:DUF4382 domain-containing protein [Burkholderiaceae bacterium]